MNTRIPSSDIVATAAALPFTRLVHFTPARNLAHILYDGQLRSSKELAEAAPEQFTPTDRERFDAHSDHVCCTFQFPNAYYQDVASQKPAHVNYPNWVILTLDKSLVLKPDAFFCGCNAAWGSGAYLQPGAQALAHCWADPSIPRGRPRGARHLPSAPTDLQAEVLIPGPIPVSAVTGIIVMTKEDAAEQQDILQRLQIDPGQRPWSVAPLLFDKCALARAIQRGDTPLETPFTPSPKETW